LDASLRSEGFSLEQVGIVGGSGSFGATFSGAAALGEWLRLPCLVMSKCGAPIYPSVYKQVQRYYRKAKKSSVGLVDASLFAEAVATINNPIAQSLGVPSQPPFGAVDQSLTALGGGGVSVAQPLSSGVGPTFSYPFGGVGGGGFLPPFQWDLFPPRPFSLVYGCSPQFLPGMSWGFNVAFLLSLGFFEYSSFVFYFSFVFVFFLYTPCMLRGAFTLLMLFLF
jgi:hypothetical protein